MTRRSRLLCAACSPVLACLSVVLYGAATAAADTGATTLACGALALFYVVAMPALACLGAALFVE